MLLCRCRRCRRRWLRGVAGEPSPTQKLGTRSRNSGTRQARGCVSGVGSRSRSQQDWLSSITCAAEGQVHRAPVSLAV